MARLKLVIADKNCSSVREGTDAVNRETASKRETASIAAEEPHATP